MGTQEYSDALNVIQDRLYEIELNKAFETLGSDIEEAKGTLDKLSQNTENLFDTDSLETFKTQLNNILDQDYQITIMVHSEAEHEFETISNGFDDLKKTAAYIGEDYVVTADKIREINNVFPGILENMQYMADGTVKLDQEMVQSAM